MNAQHLFRLVGTGAAVVGLGVASAGVSAAPAGTAAAPKISGAGVGKVKLGKSYKKLRAQGLVGKIGPGCELGGPNTRSAKLKAPLKGFVNFTLQAPRKVTDITLRGGATGRGGTGIGSSISEIQDAYPTAKVDHSTEDVFELTLVRVPKSGGGRIHFGVSTKTNKTTVVGVPNIGFCD
jgi:hypothetical protein